VIRDRQQAEACPTRRPGTGRVPLDAAGRAFEGVGMMLETSIELGDMVRRRALLRPVCRGRATLAEERVRHVAGDPEVGLRQPRVEATEIDLLDVLAVGRDDGSERFEDPGPAVVGRAASDPERDVADTVVESRPQETPGAARRSAQGIELVIPKP
jgi:hypothetical protein